MSGNSVGENAFMMPEVYDQTCPSW